MAKSAPAATVRAAAPPLRVGTSGDYPPFSVRAADGSMSGFDVAVAQAYARDRGRELELVLFAWPDLERRLMTGDFDVAMSGVTVRGDRLALGPMTAAVARASAVLVVPASRTAPAAADGTGLEVAVNRGGHLERIARSRLPRATIVTLDDNRSLPTVLASGDVDGVVTDTLELQSFTLHGGPTPRVALVLSEDRKAYWVAPRDSALAADLDAWLALREADGTLPRLRVQELGGTGERTTDAAELAVVDLVARRLLLMPEVAAVKRVAGLPVDAPAREAEVYARARAEATRVGLAPEPYAMFVRAQVEAAKAVQRAVLAQPHRPRGGLWARRRPKRPPGPEPGSIPRSGLRSTVSTARCARRSSRRRRSGCPSKVWRPRCAAMHRSLASTPGSRPRWPPHWREFPPKCACRKIPLEQEVRRSLSSLPEARGRRRGTEGPSCPAPK